MSPRRDLETVGRAVTDLAPRLAGGGAELLGLRAAGGNAGFSYLFDLAADGRVHQFFLRLAPPGVRRAGTADVFRQAAALRALDHTSVPHPTVVADGTHPLVGDFLVTSVVSGSSRGFRGSIGALPEPVRALLPVRAAAALAELHRVDPGPELNYLGDFEGTEGAVTRWDRFVEKGVFAEELRPDLQRARALLLVARPSQVRLTLTHGDYQFGNLMFDDAGKLTAVIDWELCGIAPHLSDLGWLLAFHDRTAWGDVARESAQYFGAAELLRHYESAGGDAEGVEWYQALAHYKYAVIASFNVALHRRGKRPDPEWEVRGPGAFTNLARAVEILA